VASPITLGPAGNHEILALAQAWIANRVFESTRSASDRFLGEAHTQVAKPVGPDHAGLDGLSVEVRRCGCGSRSQVGADEDLAIADLPVRALPEWAFDQPFQRSYINEQRQSLTFCRNSTGEFTDPR